jgi:hypothetical protein
MINGFCDGVFEFLNFGAHKNQYQFQLFLCLLNILFSVWPLLCFFLYTADIHVVFWLGSTPQYVNLAVPLVLLVLNICITIFRYTPTSQEKIGAQLSCFLIFLLVGSVLVGAGSYVFMITDLRATELTHHCGEKLMTRRLESEWASLNSFYGDCDPKRENAVDQCEGFEDNFPDQTFANYLEALELEFGCTGFCRFWAKPLFNQASESAQRCASSVAEHIYSTAYTVGAATMGLGATLILVGVCLGRYDHL